MEKIVVSLSVLEEVEIDSMMKYHMGEIINM